MAINKSSPIWSAYCFHRQNGLRASAALIHAKVDGIAGKPRYPSGPSSTAIGKPYASGSTMLQWVENPKAIGLRFAGYADKLARLSHNGWFTDEFQDETLRGVVYQLPARDGVSLYVAGHDNACNGEADSGGPAALAFREIIKGRKPDDDQREAARLADHIAEHAAELKREYQEASSAGLEFCSLGESVVESRKMILALCAERREAMRGETKAPTICAVVRRKIQTLLADIHKSRAKRTELYEQWTGSPNSYAMRRGLDAVFREGAGL